MSNKHGKKAPSNTVNIVSIVMMIIDFCFPKEQQFMIALLASKNKSILMVILDDHHKSAKHDWMECIQLS